MPKILITFSFLFFSVLSMADEAKLSGHISLLIQDANALTQTLGAARYLKHGRLVEGQDGDPSTRCYLKTLLKAPRTDGFLYDGFYQISNLHTGSYGQIEFQFDEGDMDPEVLSIRCENDARAVSLNDASEAMGPVGLFFTDAGIVQPTKILFICQPVDPGSSVSHIILDRSPDFHYRLSFIISNPCDLPLAQSAPATEYDDMTYIGYDAESLKAALEFDYPIRPTDGASLNLSGNWIRVSCQEPAATFSNPKR